MPSVLPKLRLSPPSDTILDSFESVGWTRADLAVRMGKTTQQIEELVMNRVRITETTAETLSSALGGSAQFWANREARYQAALAQRRGDD
jgi:plasmid maintenance system antidote protein VapI